MSVLRAEQHLLQHSVEHAIPKKGMRSKGDKKKKKITGYRSVLPIICSGGKYDSLALRTKILGKRQNKTVEKINQLYLGLH